MSHDTPAGTETGDLPSIWPGLWGVNADGPYLSGARCTACGYVTLGVRRTCPSCWAAEQMEPMPIGREGTLYTYTIIHQAPAGFEAPFAVGYVDMPGDVRVFAHLERGPQALRIGAKVVLAIEALKTNEDGTRQYGPRYRMAPKDTR